MTALLMYEGHQVDLQDPDSGHLPLVDIAVHLARACRHNGAIWLDSMFHLTLALTYCDVLDLSPWVRAYYLARVLPDGMLGAPQPSEVLPPVRALRERWRRAMRRRLLLEEVEPDVVRIALDALERRLLVLELTMGGYPHAAAVAEEHGGPLLELEHDAWHRANATYSHNRARPTVRRLSLRSAVVPEASLSLLRREIHAAMRVPRSPNTWSEVAQSWRALIKSWPGLLNDPEGRRLFLPVDVELELEDSELQAANEELGR